MMSEEKVEANEDGAEPSIEDILASIRRVLQEDEEGGVAPEEETPVPAVEEPEEEDDMDTGPDSEPEPVALPEPMPEPAPAPIPELEPVPEPAPIPEPAPVSLPPPVAATPPPPVPVAENILELTREMVAPAETMSGAAMQQSSDLPGDLARTIMDRQDFRAEDSGVGANITLEHLVRQMLGPLLREWLDSNLPYLIEHLVRKEIDLMVNRTRDMGDIS